jgi:pimeloyl-ACP methyl ester carboxylesterase
VFVHCWACDRTYWREQVDVFAADHQVVTLDLAGHGESGAGRETWTVKGLAGDVQAVVEALDLERVILIGHSMGGPVSRRHAAYAPSVGEAPTRSDSRAAPPRAAGAGP